MTTGCGPEVLVFECGGGVVGVDASRCLGESRRDSENFWDQRIHGPRDEYLTPLGH